MTDEQITTYLEKNKVIKKDKTWDYLLKLPLTSLSKSTVEKLNNELKELKNKFDSLKRLTIIKMWKNDLEELF